MRRLIGGLLLAALGACAAAIQHDLIRSSARAIVPTPNPDSVTVSEIHRDRLGNPTRWVATTRSGIYDCSREVEETEAICAKRGN